MFMYSSRMFMKYKINRSWSIKLTIHEVLFVKIWECAKFFLKSSQTVHYP